MTQASNKGTRAGAHLSRTRPGRYWTLVCATMLAFGFAVERSAAGHREHEEQDIWFVHATDPHIFIPPGKPGREEQQKQNQETLSALFKWIGSLPDGSGSPAFLVLTGDLGVDPCDIREAGAQPGTPTPTPTPNSQRNPQPAPEAEEATKQEAPSMDDCLKVKQDQHDSQVKDTARILGESPVQDIYLVAGNNDIATESAGDPALKYFNDFIQDVQKELIKDKSSVRLHNLTRCYTSSEALGSCYADIPHTAYRLLGFSSYSFKKSEEKAQFEKFRQLLEDSRKQGMKALVITHTPELDDPYALAQQRYVNPKATSAALPAPSVTPTASAAMTAPAESATPAQTPTSAGTATSAPKTKKTQTQTDKSSSVSTWNVTEKMLDDWHEAITSESILGVFAGHLHDSHKEIYRRPYAWSSGSPGTFQKLFLAPPLAVKNQVTSPIQARGFALVHLQADRIDSRLFWYDSETRAFTPDSKPESRCEQPHFWRGFCHGSHAAIRWLWNLDTGNALERMAVLLIAFLTAFLTIVAIWQIPPADDPFPEVKKSAAGETKPAQPAANFTDSSPFSSRFGKTVIAGLAGLVAAEVTKTLGNEKPTADSRWYYIVWFILFFFFLLVSLNLWRALVEGLRSRFAIIYYPLPRPPEPQDDARSQNQSGNAPPRETSVRWPGLFWRWLVYRFYAAMHWLRSWLGVPLVTFADTFINLIQGKNQTATKIFSDKIVDQQRNVLRVAKEIREQLNTVILEYLRDQARKKDPDRRIASKDVRVNVSVLSADRTNVFYISKTRDSSRLSFPKRSVAWLSVFTGKIRWHKLSYDKGALSKEIILFDNSAGTIPDEVAKIPLNSYYQARGGDYEAFVVFPVPLSQRGLESDYVKGAIQISFSRETDFDLIWSFKPTPEEIRETATNEVDAKIKAASNATERQQLQQTREADLQAAVTTAEANPPPDPVVDKLQYQSEERMLTTPWCTDAEVRATLYTSLRVLGEVLRGFNENIYKSIAKSEQPD
jgi:hypothetical protein